MRNKLLPLIGFLAFMLSNCNPISPPPGDEIPDSPHGITTSTAEPDPNTIGLEYPKVDGSTSAHPLQVLLACKIHNVPCIWMEGWPLDPTRRMIPDPDFSDDPQLSEKIVNIWHNGPHSAYINLIEGNADFILVARLPSEDELKEAHKRGILLDVQPIALDAFVFIVNTINPIETLTLDSIRNIYTREITHWSDLGIEGIEIEEIGDGIHTYQRNRNSGSQELMESLVMGELEMIESPDMILDSMIGPINAIADDPLGIGYSVYYYASFMFPHESIKLIGVDGVAPTSTNIADRSYPLTTEVYAVIREGMPLDSTAVMLRNWTLTASGQSVIKDSGYVPID